MLESHLRCERFIALSDQLTNTDRVRTNGKYFSLAGAKWYVKGFVYGPFAPNDDGDHLPDRATVASDFIHIRNLGANTIRVYHVPPAWVLELAAEHDIRVFVDVPWEKHRCFFEDSHVPLGVRDRVRDASRAVGGHPNVLAISVANEIPIDVVRFYGRRRIEDFLSELLRIVRQEAPDCLATYCNYPTTEFLQPRECDFLCFNVYLHDVQKLDDYVMRLQHIAGNMPLILGEFGADSLTQGEIQQARLVTQHAGGVLQRGLAGTIVFSYTDDWFTGGAQIENWAFGATRRDRSEKPLAQELRNTWQRVPCIAVDRLPRISVVVCTFNGARTIRECLESLRRQDYPSYDVHVIDDGSTDETSQIVREFPEVHYFHQPNDGLSAARNVGVQRATGEIVAYTDDDCVVEQDWLRHLVQCFEDLQVDAAGGPNITPQSDSWAAKCVALCPGNPSHVMLDDRCAEHVPGCNMAFRRQALLDMGGFDPQFRQAGDDVDVFWRMIDAGKKIGFAPGAMVWHRRRDSLMAFLAQQRGYGRAEARLQRKHPHRSNVAGMSVWHGIIYGDHQYGSLAMEDIIYHGRFGSAPFQMRVHRESGYHWHFPLTLEWHGIALALVVLGSLHQTLWFLAGLMWLATVIAAVKLSSSRRLPNGAPWWCRPLLVTLFILQPVVRRATRLWNLVQLQRLPSHSSPEIPAGVRRHSSRQWDLNWQSDTGIGRLELLEDLADQARRGGWAGNFTSEWSETDLSLPGDLWHNITLRTATEELGGNKRFTRARFRVHFTVFTGLAACLFAAATVLAWVALRPLPLTICVLAGLCFAWFLSCSRRRCLTVISQLAACSAEAVGLRLVDPNRSQTEIQPRRDLALSEP